MGSCPLSLYLTGFSMGKTKIYKKIIKIFLDKVPNDNIIKEYINKTDDGIIEMQDFIGLNLKQEISFATALSIMDCIDIIYNGAVENDNFRNYLID